MQPLFTNVFSELLSVIGLPALSKYGSILPGLYINKMQNRIKENPIYIENSMINIPMIDLTKYLISLELS